MATNDERLGFDPLAWMAEDKKNIDSETKVLSDSADTDTKVIADSVSRAVSKPASKPVKKVVRKKVVRKKTVRQTAATGRQTASSASEAKVKEAAKADTETKPVVTKESNTIEQPKTEVNTMATKSSDTETQIKNAVLNAMTSAVMTIDLDLVITFINPAAQKLMKSVERRLQQNFPDFNADKLIGKCIDDFHKNPSHQRRLLSDPSNLPYKGIIDLGDIQFDLNVTPMYDDIGNFIGACQEWKDITELKKAQIQIEGLIDVAANGELNERLNADDFDGTMKNIVAGMNRMLDQFVRPVHSIMDVVKALEEGNLVKRMDGEFEGEFSVLQNAMNQSMNNLLKMVSEIRASASHISSAANEISQGNTDLSQRTEEQASSLEETASSMEQLTSTVKQNADNSRQANQLAASARDQAQEGGDVINSTISAMEEINAASKKIEDIIGVIDEIAFQTNLLALNAAVEAARAGEQGRGFAVVASEVRSLAQRSAAAAKEIKALIKDSVEKVEEGTRLVDDSGNTLGEIVNSVRKVSDIIAEIAAASSEQSAGIEQVNKAITQLDEVTQQNAALVEEAAAASESMDDQARTLNEMMNFFETGETELSVSASPAVERTASAAAKTTRKAAQAVLQPMAAKVASAPATAGDDSEWEEF